MRITTAAWTAALLNVGLYHLPLWQYVAKHVSIEPGHAWPIYLAVVVALTTVTAVLFLLLALLGVRPFRRVMQFFFIGNALALYFVQSYHVLLDKSMMGNVFNTDWNEAASYLSGNMILYVVGLGVVPAWLFGRLSITFSSRRSIVLQAFGALVVGVGVLYADAKTWPWIDRHAKRLGGLSMPWSYTINAVRFWRDKAKKHHRYRLLPDGTFEDNSSQLVVLVIGESARQDHFALYGYARPTNPELSGIKGLSVLNGVAAATYTTASVQAILSYNGSTSGEFEPLPNYLHRMGAEVIWRANNWGEPPRLKVDTYQKASELRRGCKGEECDYDGVLLRGLKQRIAQARTSKILVVLHTVGSHGPNYTEKYPASFEYFKPVCRSVDLQSCTHISLINAYDNTIRYTDHLLADTIALLRSLPIPSMMIYLSDHGESLGEYGLYLHGTPYTIAPDAQKRIPFIIWRSDGKVLTKQCKKSRYGQRYVFHTVLGALGVRSEAYIRAYDVFACDKAFKRSCQ